MRQTIKGVIIGVVVAAGVSVLLAQSATWTTPRNWATDDLLTAADFNAQFRDNLLWLRQDAQLTGTDALEDLGCGTLGTNEVLFSDCSWATIPAGVVFDIHDDVGTAATIADNDRIPFSDEGSAGDPMRFTTAANLADYMQVEVDLSANRITSDTFSVDRIPNLPASKLPAPPAVTIDALGCNGTPSADTFLRGDCEWAELPTTTVVALDMGDTTTTASTYQTVGPTVSLAAVSGQTIAFYLSGNLRNWRGCYTRLVNLTTATDIFENSAHSIDTLTANRFIDVSPSTTATNTYALQMRRDSGNNSCRWFRSVLSSISVFTGTSAGARGMIAVVL